MDAPKLTVERARRLRRRMSLPEVVLWRVLRAGFAGCKFRRQHPFGPYIVDFYCDAQKLAVEIDGSGHDQPDAMRHDARRDAWISARGVRIVRIPARAVLADLEAVLEGLREEVGAR
ncbi:endonuclease domain-containing protein [Caulobacter sp. 17J65-9]|uniref:endonuclease domain-containing protein n=1 Tax=Caulobacter sp. 17J65-9 TaxID=2709382 RepID=UPI0013CD04CE|nr:endonuclease domain-containing protein [Caulobacter sp. 17J65-9]NEX94479.1 DUF559 domain-containing protein [Caulobacter sp. 17J65-9]